MTNTGAPLNLKLSKEATDEIANILLLRHQFYVNYHKNIYERIDKYLMTSIFQNRGY